MAEHEQGEPHIQDRDSRVRYYRQLAREAEQSAANTKFLVAKEGFLKLATGWRMLADSTERL